jgi:hypothetical protein
MAYPFPKKLRFVDPDLTVTVCCTDKEVNEEKQYSMYSMLLANHSGFVDAALSNEMKEKKDGTIFFEGIHPDNFELAIQIVECEGMLSSMIPHHSGSKLDEYEKAFHLTKEVVTFYDKYEFTRGLEISNEHLEHLVTMVPLNHWGSNRTALFLVQIGNFCFASKSQSLKDVFQEQLETFKVTLMSPCLCNHHRHSLVCSRAILRTTYEKLAPVLQAWGKENNRVLLA